MPQNMLDLMVLLATVHPIEVWKKAGQNWLAKLKTAV